MSHRPSEPPREPYGALATFLIVPLIAATVAFTAPHGPAPAAAPSYTGASLGAPLHGSVALPAMTAHRDTTGRHRVR